jgi:hypothetical protein
VGYNLKIGNAVLEEVDPDDCDGKFCAKYLIEGAHHDGAPAFGEPTDYTNQRWPSYSAWADFCKETGLHALFFDKYDGIMREHPGCFKLTEDHLGQVREALERRKQTTGGRPPGFYDYDEETQQDVDNGNDPQTARLVWLEYWMAWALEHCERPAIENS